MDFRYSEEQLAVQEMTRRFAREQVLPGVRQRDDQGEVPGELIGELLAMGFGGIMVPEKWGGMGMDSVSFSLAIEELSAVDLALAVTISVTNALGCWALQHHGTQPQKNDFLRPLASGDKLAAFCLTEEQAGSDVAAVATTAVLDGECYVINGRKRWVANGGSADLLLVICSSGPDGGHQGSLALLVDRETPGVHATGRTEMMGLRCLEICDVVFSDVRVPAGNLLGQEGRGSRIALGALAGSRIGVASQALGVARGAFELACEYAAQREQFGRPIAEFQATQFKFAEMAMRIEAARLLIYKACALRDGLEPYAHVASMAKLFASETAGYCARECVQIHGGYGYSREYHAERLMRDARVLELYGGTSEIQRIVISRAVMQN